MRTLVAAAILAFVTGWAVGATVAPAEPAAAQSVATEGTGAASGAAADGLDPPSVCLGSHGNDPTDSRDLMVTPASQFSFDVLGPATDVRVVIALCSGANLGAQVKVPEGCESETMAVNVIGLSNGQAVTDIRCPELAAGENFFLLETGGSAFAGRVDVYGASFA